MHGLLPCVRPDDTNTPNEKHIFVQGEGKSLNAGTMQKAARIGRDAEVPRLHRRLLLHASATDWLIHSGDMIDLQRKLGHSSLTMTDRYVHLASDKAATIQERVAPMPDRTGQALDKLDVKPMRVPKSN